MRKRGSLQRDQQEEKTVRVEALAVEVEKMKSEHFEAEQRLLQDKELASKWSGSCATHASEREKPTETAVARRGTERTSATEATMATRSKGTKDHRRGTEQRSTESRRSPLRVGEEGA